MNIEIYRHYANDANDKFVMKIMNTCSIWKLLDHLTLKKPVVRWWKPQRDPILDLHFELIGNNERIGSLFIWFNGKLCKLNY